MMKIKAFGCIVLVVASMILVTTVTATDYEDLEYLEWSLATGKKFSEYTELVPTEMEKGIVDCDWEYVRTLAKLEYYYAETALDEIDQFEVSPGYEPIKNEQKLYLIDRKWAAHYLKEAAEDTISGDIDGAIDNLDESQKYMTSSISHLEKQGALLQALPTPTPESPGFGAIFAIVSLLVVVFGLRKWKK